MEVDPRECDVFLSYSREDLERAKEVAEELAAHGWDVFWDSKLIPGDRFHRKIEEWIIKAKCVVVLWSGRSAESDWVTMEATEALRRDKLVPALIEKGAQVPLPFRAIHQADLVGWSREKKRHESFSDLLLGIERHAGPPRKREVEARTFTPLPVSPPLSGPTPRPKWGWLVVFPVVVAAGFGILALSKQQGSEMGTVVDAGSMESRVETPAALDSGHGTLWSERPEGFDAGQVPVKKGEEESVGTGRRRRQDEAAPARDTSGTPSLTTPLERKTDEKTGLAWVHLPAGKFPYGCVKRDTSCYDNEKKPSETRSVNSFWMMETEVTVKTYEACANAGRCSREPQGQDTETKTCNWKNGRADHPMNCLNHAEATSFCRWVGGRLPTAEEWEYAAKSGRAAVYPWGEAPATGKRANFCDKNCPKELLASPANRSRDNGWIDEKQDDGHASTAPMGSYPLGDTAWGLKDMAGNVWEWTASNYDATSKEVRGGGWRHSAWFLRASNRNRHAPSAANDGLGFRCAQ